MPVTTAGVVGAAVLIDASVPWGRSVVGPAVLAVAPVGAAVVAAAMGSDDDDVDELLEQPAIPTRTITTVAMRAIRRGPGTPLDGIRSPSRGRRMVGRPGAAAS